MSALHVIPRVPVGGARRVLLAVVVLGSLVAAGFGAGSADAAARRFAPVNRPGPKLRVASSVLHRSLTCTANVRSARREAILLVPGTALSTHEFDWNYKRAFAARHLPFCSVSLPNHALSDIQVSAEYVVFALRRMHALTHRKVQVVGHSQGGMIGRWALRFWPDTRRLVDDLIGLAPSNHGTDTAEAACVSRCPPSFFQQETRARFIQALNSFQETFRGISYTVAYTHFDEVVTPNTNSRGSSSLHTGSGWIANIALQDICPTNTNEHFAIGTYDPVGYAIALDALTHRGPADPARISRSVCGRAFQPGVNPVTFPTDFAGVVREAAFTSATYRKVAAEPALKCYVFAACKSAARPVHHRPRPRFTG